MPIGSVDDLRAIYRQPGRGAVDKVTDHLDEHCARFLARSPFFVLSTAGADGACDGSPKGGPPGFAAVLDDHHLAWGDLAGNNRLDSFQNLVANDRVALLFLIPGLDETLRVNGRAELRTDPDLCERFAVDGKPVRVVVVVQAEEVYLHCGKALRRSALWSPESWPAPDTVPSIGCMVRDQMAAEVAPEAIEAGLEADYAATLWEPGGGR